MSKKIIKKVLFKTTNNIYGDDFLSNQRSTI